MRGDDYQLVRVMNAELVGLDCGEFGQQMWARVRVRKTSTCVLCGLRIEPRAMAFSPITNLNNRMDRIHATCLDPIIVAVQAHEESAGKAT